MFLHNPMWACPQQSHAMLPSKQHSRRVLTDGGACSRYTAPPFRNACATDGIPAQDLEDAPACTLSVPESTRKTRLRAMTWGKMSFPSSISLFAWALDNCGEQRECRQHGPERHSPGKLWVSSRAQISEGGGCKRGQLAASGYCKHTNTHW